MSNFWKVRLCTFFWGFAVLYAFTGELNLSSTMLFVQVAGNTLVMWWWVE